MKAVDLVGRLLRATVLVFGLAMAGCSSGSAQPARTCDDGEALCGDTCVEVQSDPTNCGGCGTACAAGELCSQGMCSLICSGGATACGSSCARTTVDPKNCGACGKVCVAGEVCTAGACVAQCPAQQTLCIGDGGATSCVTTTSDGNNCGACGNACPSGEVCSQGSCAATCGAGEKLCPPGDGGAVYCANEGSDQNNCGSCGNACATGLTCSAGTCQAICSPPLALCSTECVDTQSDRENCNACGTKCSGSTPYCIAGKCAKQNILEDFENPSWIRSPWVAQGGSTTTKETAACAHDGKAGLSGDSGWIYRTDVSIGASGSALSAWARDTGGRVYLGFSSTSSGTYSIVLAPNTNAFIIQQNTGYTAYTDLATQPYTYVAGAWYRLGLAFGASGFVTGTLYDATNTAVATVSTTISGLAAGGVSYRGFGTVSCIDTIMN